MIRYTLIAALIVAAPVAAAETLVTKLEALAKQGNAKALYHLGMMYQTGTDVTRDHARALSYFREAAAKGYPLAAYKLGCFYAGQDDVLPFDENQALHYKTIAAEAGYALAQSDVAGIYIGRREAKPAQMWADRAAAQGTTTGLAAAATVYSGRTVVAKDPVRMVAYLTLMFEKIGPSETQRVGIAKLKTELSATDQKRADTMIAAYRPAPTALTREALLGSVAAQALVRP